MGPLGPMGRDHGPIRAHEAYGASGAHGAHRAHRGGRPAVAGGGRMAAGAQYRKVPLN